MVQAHNVRLAKWRVWQLDYIDFVIDSHWSAIASGIDAYITEAHALELN